MWATFTDGGPPFSPATWPAQFSALLSTAQAGGPPYVKIGWATKTIIFEDVRRGPHFSHANSLGKLQFCEFFSANVY